MKTKLTQACAFICGDGMGIRAVVYDLCNLDKPLWEAEDEVPNFARMRIAAANAQEAGKICKGDYLELSEDLARMEYRWQLDAINRHRPRYSAIAAWLAIGAATVLFWGAAVYGVCKAIGG